jgi:hypothetical protein
VGPSKGAVVLLSIRPPMVKGLKNRPRLLIQVKSRAIKNMNKKRTHQTFRSRLTTYSLYFTDFIKGYAILAEETAVRDEIPLETVR